MYCSKAVHPSPYVHNMKKAKLWFLILLGCTYEQQCGEGKLYFIILRQPVHVGSVLQQSSTPWALVSQESENSPVSSRLKILVNIFLNKTRAIFGQLDNWIEWSSRARAVQTDGRTDGLIGKFHFQQAIEDSCEPTSLRCFHLYDIQGVGQILPNSKKNIFWTLSVNTINKSQLGYCVRFELYTRKVQGFP